MRRDRRATDHDPVEQVSASENFKRLKHRLNSEPQMIALWIALTQLFECVLSGSNAVLQIDRRPEPTHSTGHSNSSSRAGELSCRQ